MLLMYRNHIFTRKLNFLLLEVRSMKSDYTNKTCFNLLLCEKYRLHMSSSHNNLEYDLV